jgi:hypothetical protein
MARPWIVLVMLCVVSCGGDDGGAVSPDARPAPDASVADASLDAEPAPDAIPGTPAHTLFLNFDGGTVRAGFESSINNTSTIITGVRNISAWADTADIPAITAEVEAILAPYSISVVTTRPDPGQYAMVMFGAGPAEAGFTSDTAGNMPVSCSTLFNGIGFVFNLVTNVHALAREAVSIVGAFHLVPFSNVADDCMCWSGSACNADTLAAACTIGGAGTTMDPGEPCETVAPFDEAARFLAAFGPHP